MKLVALAVLSTVVAAAVPAVAAPVSADQTFQVAQADINVRIGEPRRNRVIVRDRRPDVVVRERVGVDAMARRHGCKTVIIKERRGGMMVTKRIKKCR